MQGAERDNYLPGTPYEPPRLRRIGTLTELTLGHTGPNQDGVFPSGLYMTVSG